MAEKMLFQSGKTKRGGLLPKIGDVALFLLLVAADVLLVMNFTPLFEWNEMMTTFLFTLMLPILILAHLGNFFTFQSRKNSSFSLSPKYLLLAPHEGKEEKVDMALINGITITNALRHSCFVIFNFDKRREVFLMDRSERDALSDSIRKAGFDEYEQLGVIGQKSYKSRTQAA